MLIRAHRPLTAVTVVNIVVMLSYKKTHLESSDSGTYVRSVIITTYNLISSHPKTEKTLSTLGLIIVTISRRILVISKEGSDI